MTPSKIKYRLSSGDWRLFFRSVYCLTSAASPFEQQLMAACLWGGLRCRASHRSAAALFELEGISRGHIEVTLPSGRHPPGPQVVVRRSRLMDRTDLARVGPIPVTSVNRTLLDLAGVVDPPVLEAALDSALRRRLTSVSAMQARLAWNGERTREGSGLLRDLLKERCNNRPTGSALEARYSQLFRCLAKLGLPMPIRQYELRDASGFIGQVDFAYPDARMAIEIDSYEWHMSRKAFVSDRGRDRRLQAIGWIVPRFTFADLNDPDSIAVEIRDLYLRRAGLPFDR